MNRPLVERRLQSGWQARVDNARKTLAAMDKRLLLYSWARNPMLPGSTVKFVREFDRDRCLRWLERVGYPIDDISPISGERPSPRCIDKSLWGALRFLVKGNICEAQALRSVRWAHLKDRCFFDKVRRIKAECDG